MKVLIAEDDANIRRGLAEILEAEGYATVQAEDGRAALDRLAAEAPDLVLLDIMMPGLSGYDVCREIRRRDGALPILFVSAFYGLVHPSYALSHNNSLLKTFPPGKEHEGIAVYNTINRIGIVICPIIGVALAEWIGDVRVVLIICGVISLLGSLSFHIWPVFQGAGKREAFPGTEKRFVEE
jgi:hypothetical protein